MAGITIRTLDEAVKAKLRVRAAAINQAEMLYGVEMLSAGKRRKRLYATVAQLFANEFAGRILPFDVESALAYPRIVAGRERRGRPISQFDALIASVCVSRSATIATRNTSDFEDCGLAIINPWDAE